MPVKDPVADCPFITDEERRTVHRFRQIRSALTQVVRAMVGRITYASDDAEVVKISEARVAKSWDQVRRLANMVTPPIEFGQETPITVEAVELLVDLIEVGVRARFAEISEKLGSQLVGDVIPQHIGDKKMG